MERYLVVISLIFSSFLYGQDLKKEFAQMNDFLNKMNSYKLSVQYTAGNEEQSENGAVSVIVNSKGLFYDINQAHLVINDEYTFLIDDQEHLLVYSENQQVKKRASFNFSDQILKGIDTLVSRSDSVMFSMNENTRSYSLRFKESYFDLIQLHFSGELLTKVDYFYNEEFVNETGVRTTCTVSLDPDIAIDEKVFDTTFYILEKDGTIVPSENFSNYLITYNEALESYLD